MAWYSTFIEYLMLKVQNKNFTKNIARKWTDIFMHSILDMLACNGWIQLYGIGKVVLKKQKDYTYFCAKKNCNITVRPKPYIYIKLHKPAIDYLNKKLQEYGLVLDQVVFYSRKKGKVNVPQGVLQWFKKQEQQKVNLDKNLK